MQTSQKDFMEKLFTVFGQVKASLWPPLLAYKPRGYALKGNQLREVLKRAQYGDILVRTFNHYLDGLFMPGTFTQVGFYLGPVTENHLKQIAKVDNPTQFNMGEQMVIHAIGQQVHLDHLLDFCRCDGLAIMRFPRQLKSLEKRPIPERLLAYFKDPTQLPNAPEEETEDGKKPKKVKKEPPQLDEVTKTLIKHEFTIAQTLAQGKIVEFEKIFKILYQVALRELTMPYNYDFEMDPFGGTSSTELVYFITKSIVWNYGIAPASRKLFLKSRRVILPDDFVNGNLEEVWKEVL